ncbi:MAG: hypothetical protein KJ601_00290 [Nanoarchaeota archaeon]|nr:hypothetical protein [Nanoarchaeota archaeon]
MKKKKAKDDVAAEIQTSITITKKAESVDDKAKVKAAEETIEEVAEEATPERSGNQVYRGIRPNVYGAGPQVKAVDYDEIYSHLGQFRAQGMYDNVSGGGNSTDQAHERSLVSEETIHDAVQWEKYFLPGDRMGDFGLVPMVKMNSKDWESFRLWSKVDYVMYGLMMQTS